MSQRVAVAAVTPRQFSAQSPVFTPRRVGHRSARGNRGNSGYRRRSRRHQLIESEARDTNNPGAQMELGQEEILLLISRDPVKTAQRLAVGAWSGSAATSPARPSPAPGSSERGILAIPFLAYPGVTGTMPRSVVHAALVLLLPIAACSSEDSGPKEQPDTSSSPDDTDSSQDVVLTLTLDSEVVTMVHAMWEPVGADGAWVEYRFEGDDWLVAPELEPGSGVILGIPADTPVEARVAYSMEGETLVSAPETITTGSLPDGMVLPTVVSWDPALAEESQWVMVSVAAGEFSFEGPFWIEIFDRSGRIVWYKEIPDDMMTLFPTVALDGTHIWYEAENIFGIGRGTPAVSRQTLDGRWSTTLEARDMGQAVCEGPDGSFFYEKRTYLTLGRLDPDGSTTTVWDCSAWMEGLGLEPANCYMNTVFWSEARDSVTASMFVPSTVFEVDLATSAPIRQMGQLDEGSPYAFSPEDSIFEFQHGVNWLESGNLLVSTHKIDDESVQVAGEYSVDDETKTLTLVWSYVSTDIRASQLGETVRLPNGNTVQGYGQDGAIREVTPDGLTAWEANWPKDGWGYRVLGHASFIPDLYALNVGG